MTTPQAPPLSHAAILGLTRDFTAALGQQMFYWGRDVIHPGGNLLCVHGFDRRDSLGLTGTSCYSKALERGFIELHGACAGWYADEREDPGFLYIRNRRRCFCYGDNVPPDPGIYANELLRTGPVRELFALSRPFLDWWIDYETWIASATGPDYREACFRTFRKLPKSKSWLPPQEAREWLRAYRDDPASLKRAKQNKHSKA